MEIGNLINLEEFNLWGNNFSGEIPDQITYLENLKRLWIDNNNFTGQIPQNIGNLIYLESLISLSHL